MHAASAGSAVHRSPSTLWSLSWVPLPMLRTKVLEHRRAGSPAQRSPAEAFSAMSAHREPAAPKRHRGGAAGDAADGTPRLRPFRPSQATAAEPRGEDGPAQTRRCARESPPGLLAPPPVEAAVAQRTAPGSRPRSRTWSRTRTRTNAYETPFVGDDGHTKTPRPGFGLRRSGQGTTGFLMTKR